MNLDNKKQLYKKIKETFLLLNNSNNIDERVILTNYINSLYDSMSINEKNRVDVYKNEEEYNKIIERVFHYNRQMLINFIITKEFHHQFLDEVLTGVEKEYQVIDKDNIEKDIEFGEKDFYYIFRSFMKSIKIEDLFDQIIKENRIHKSPIQKEGWNQYKIDNGYFLFNPLNKDYDIFINNFSYNIKSMFTLAHEIGHLYDLYNLNTDANKYNEYYFQSFYGEVYSELFERLCMNYMLSNNIEEEVVISQSLNFEHDNFANLSLAYILSCLDNEFLLEDDYYTSRKKKKVASKVAKNFTNKKVVKNFIEIYDPMIIPSKYNYAYGNIISMILKELVLSDGLNNELVKTFRESRNEVFNTKLLDKMNITSEKYLNLYQKELKLIKK